MKFISSATSELLSTLQRARPTLSRRSIRQHDVFVPRAHAAGAPRSTPGPVPPTPTPKRAADDATAVPATAVPGTEPSTDPAPTIAEAARRPGATLTRESLAMWETAAGLVSEERHQRRMVAEYMRRAGCAETASALRIPGRLWLDGCRDLTTLPDGLVVEGDLDLRHCVALTALPVGLAVSGRLNLYGCSALTALPEGLTVGRDLDLRDCTRLTRLPARLTVAAHLSLRGCTALTALPAGLTVGGTLDLRGCTALTALPEEILTWGPCRSPAGNCVRQIFLGSGLSASLQTRLRTMQPPPEGLQFMISMPPEPEEGVASVAAGIAFWWGLVPDAPCAMPNASPWALAATDANALQTFLGRLRQTADYHNVAVRPALAARVVALLAAMQDPAVRVMALERIHEALTSCGDRVVLMLNQIELALRVQGLTDGDASDTALRALGLALLKLEVVHRHAARTAGLLVMVDEIEVYLAYETRLRERLGLPVSTQNMLYERCANVTHAMLDAAYIDAMITVSAPNTVAAFLASWEPWQIHTRRTAMAHTPWESLPQQPLDLALTRDAQCCITLEHYSSLQKPVILLRGDTWVVCDYDAFAVWWVRHGTHPTLLNEPVALDILRRPAPP